MALRTPLPRAGAAYVTAVAVIGCSIVVFSAYDLFSGFREPRHTLQWALLAALTLLSGSATVKLPSVPATISISETFVFTSVLLFGPSAGAVIVALDGLIISFWFVRGRRDLHRVLFNIAAPALSIFLAAFVYFSFPGTAPLVNGGRSGSLITSFILPLGAFTVLHFLINSWLIAVAVAFETSRSAFDIWRRDFLWLSLNYFGGASVSALFVLSKPERDIGYGFVSIIVPLLLILYFTFKIPMARVEDTNRHLGKVNSLYLSTIETLAMAIDAKDQVTHGHIRRVQAYAVGLAKELRVCDEGLLKAIEASALLHDMGKLAIPEHILNKPGKLSAAEFDKMKLHASIGADILSSIEFPYPVIPIVRHHHENWDGTGYPVGLSGTQIPIGARILAVVDCYDALTSDRPYRPRLSDESATAILLERRGSMYDPLVVDTFIRVHNHLVPEELENHIEQRQTFADIARLSAAAAQGRDIDQAERLDQAIDQIVTWSLTEAPGQALVHRAEFVAETLTAVTRSAAALIALYDPVQDNLHVIHTARLASKYVPERIGLGERLTGWVAANRQVIANSDPLLDLSGVPDTRSLRASLGVPLVARRMLNRSGRRMRRRCEHRS